MAIRGLGSLRNLSRNIETEEKWKRKKKTLFPPRRENRNNRRAMIVKPC